MSDSPRRTLTVWLPVLTPAGYALAAGFWEARPIRAALHPKGPHA